MVISVSLGGCLWTTTKAVPKEPGCGKIIVPPIPEGKDIPEYKVVKPNQGISATPSGGAFFPHSAFSVLEFNIKSLRVWMNDVVAQIRAHNDNVDKITERIKKDAEKKKGWW